MNIFQMSFYASILIIVVLVIRIIALYKLPKKIFLILWGIVLFRLLVPISILFQFNFYKKANMAKLMLIDRTGIGHFVKTNTNTGDLFEYMETYTVPLSLFKILWIIGIFAFVMFFVITYIGNQKKFNMSLPVKNDFVTLWLKDNSLHRSIQVRQSDCTKSPLTYGIFHPVILVPKGIDWTKRTELEYIFAHEFVHICHFDALIKLLLTIAVCIHWFNPLVWVMYKIVNRDIELLCDELVIQNTGIP